MQLWVSGRCCRLVLPLTSVGEAFRAGISWEGSSVEVLARRTLPAAMAKYPVSNLSRSFSLPGLKHYRACTDVRTRTESRATGLEWRQPQNKLLGLNLSGLLLEPSTSFGWQAAGDKPSRSLPTIALFHALLRRSKRLKASSIPSADLRRGS